MLPASWAEEAVVLEQAQVLEQAAVQRLEREREQIGNAFDLD